MFVAFRILLAIHIMLGTVAIAVGAVALGSTKGARRHRDSGRAFMWAMGVVICSAAGMTALRINPYFAGLTASATVLVFLDPPWRQLWAVTLGQTLAVILVVHYRHAIARGHWPGPTVSLRA